jgi:hypothetical protein
VKKVMRGLKLLLIGENPVTFPDKETNEDIRMNYRLVKWQVDPQTTERMIGTS